MDSCKARGKGKESSLIDKKMFEGGAKEGESGQVTWVGGREGRVHDKSAPLFAL